MFNFLTTVPNSSASGSKVVRPLLALAVVALLGSVARAELVLHYSFNSATTGDGQSIQDDSGMGRHGTIVGNALAEDEIVFDADRGSKVFQGDGFKGHVVAPSVFPTAPFGGLGSDVSISAWVKDDGDNQWGWIASINDSVGISVTAILDENSGISSGYYYNGNGWNLTTTNDEASFASTFVSDGAWHHLVMTFDSTAGGDLFQVGDFPSKNPPTGTGSGGPGDPPGPSDGITDGVISYYIDGTLARQFNGSGPIDWDTRGGDGTFTVGALIKAGNNLGDRHFNGFIDDVRVYNHVLSAAEIGTSLTGDFNQDEAIDGADFLIWQRGGSPTPLSSGDLAAWQAAYNSGSAVGATTSVPEPSSLLLSALAAIGLSVRRKW